MGKTIVTEKPEKEYFRHCSFCGQSSEQVSRMIAGPGVNICDKCVKICQDILAEDMHKDDLKKLNKKIAEPSAEEWFSSFVLQISSMAKAFPKYNLGSVPSKLHPLLDVLDDLEPKNLAMVKKEAASLLRAQIKEEAKNKTAQNKSRKKKE